MGWASGSDLADKVWGVVREHLPADKRQECARRVLDLFRNQDADDFTTDDPLLMDAGIRPGDSY